MKKAVLFFADGTEEVEALTAVDILRRAGAEVVIAGVGGVRLTGSHGIKITADLPAEEIRPADYDMVILPGGMPGTKNLDASAAVDGCLRETAEKGGLLAAICAAPMILGERGYLAGKTATCYPGFENDEKYHGTYTAAPLQQDGKMITANGAGNALTFALYLLAALQGEEKALEVGRSIQMKL